MRGVEELSNCAGERYHHIKPADTIWNKEWDQGDQYAREISAAIMIFFRS